MRAFITGSRAYGRPTKYSDLDLVIHTDQATKRALERYAGVEQDTPVYFGVGNKRINLIICETEEQMAVWKLGTAQLQLKREEEGPINKEYAKEFFMELLESVNEAHRRVSQ